MKWSLRTFAISVGSVYVLLLLRSLLGVILLDLLDGMIDLRMRACRFGSCLLSRSFCSMLSALVFLISLLSLFLVSACFLMLAGVGLRFLSVSLVLYSDESSDFWRAPRLASGFGFGLIVVDSMLNSMDDVFELVIDRHVGIVSSVDCSDNVCIDRIACLLVW